MDITNVSLGHTSTVPFHTIVLPHRRLKLMGSLDDNH